MPPYSVVVSGSLPGKPLPDGSPGPSLYCAVIVKTVDAQTRAKTGHQRALAGVSARPVTTARQALQDATPGKSAGAQAAEQDARRAIAR